MFSYFLQGKILDMRMENYSVCFVVVLFDDIVME